MHTMRVSERSMLSLLDVSQSSLTRWIADYQNNCLDMLAVIETKLQGEVEIDGTYLSGRKTEKKGAGGRVMGARGRHAEKTLLMIQQRKSQRFTALQTQRHENAEAADQLALASVEPGSETTLFTDGGHSLISAWNHLPSLLNCERRTVNHSRHMVCPRTGISLLVHAHVDVD